MAGPTVINNAETLATVPHIFRIGGAEYAELGAKRNGGTSLFCLSGNVEKPGVYELPMGFNIKKMIYDVAGGIRAGDRSRQSFPEALRPQCFCPVKLTSAWTSPRLAWPQHARVGRRGCAPLAPVTN